MLRLHTIAKIGSSEERKIALAALLNENCGNLGKPEQQQAKQCLLQPKKIPLHSMQKDQQTLMEQQTQMEQQTWTEQQTWMKQQTWTEQQTWMDQQTNMGQQTNTDAIDNPMLKLTPTALPSKPHKSTLHADDLSHKRHWLQ